MIVKKSQSKMNLDRKYSSTSPTHSFLSRNPFQALPLQTSTSKKDTQDAGPSSGCYCGYEIGISSQNSFAQLKKKDSIPSSRTPPKGRRNTSANSSKAPTPTLSKSKHQKSQSFSIISPNCAECSAKVKNLIEVKRNLTEATKTLYPYRTASYSVQSAQREQDLMYQNAGRSSHVDKLSQDVVSKSIELNDLTKSVLPKLKRERKFGATFDRKKNDVVIPQEQMIKLHDMLQIYKTLEFQLLHFAAKLHGTSYQLRDETSILEIFDFLVQFFEVNAFEQHPRNYPITFLNQFAAQNCKSTMGQSRTSLGGTSYAEESETQHLEEPSFQASTLSMINEAPVESVQSFAESVRDRSNMQSRASYSRYSENETPEQRSKFIVNIDEDDLIVVVDKKQKGKKTNSTFTEKANVESGDENEIKSFLPFMKLN